MIRRRNDFHPSNASPQGGPPNTPIRVLWRG
jgi:hypothetical protein